MKKLWMRRRTKRKKKREQAKKRGDQNKSFLFGNNADTYQTMACEDGSAHTPAHPPSFFLPCGACDQSTPHATTRDTRTVHINKK